MPYAQNDCVRVLAIRELAAFAPDGFNRRPPRVGDLACIVEVYTNPAGYELECCEGGITVWLRSVGPDEIVLERIG